MRNKTCNKYYLCPCFGGNLYLLYHSLAPRAMRRLCEVRIMLAIPGRLVVVNQPVAVVGFLGFRMENGLRMVRMKQLMK